MTKIDDFRVPIDPRNGGDRWLFEHHDCLVRTRVHETRRIGWHFIFNHSPGLRSRVVAPGVEFLSGGRWAVWWPEHAGRVLCEGPVAALPGWLHEMVASRNGDHEKKGWPLQMAKAGELPKPLYFEVLRLVPLSDKVTRRHQRWVMSILSIVTQLREGRNNALNVAAFRLRELIEAEVLSRDAAEQLLFLTAEVCGYVAKDGERAAMATIRSGLGSPIGRDHSFFCDNEFVGGNE